MRLSPLLAAAFLLSLSLGACSGLKSNSEIEKLNEAKAVGSPFTKRLTLDYRDYSHNRQSALDYTDAKHFARKGLMAAEGRIVMPEPLSNWHLDDASAKELRQGRTDLLQLLNAGARAQTPVDAADAQANFDCWIEQQEQAWISNRSVPCKESFKRSLSDLQTRMKNNLPPSVKAGQPIPEAKKPTVTSTEAPPANPDAVAAGLDEGSFLVFFDWDRSLLNGTGNQVIDQIVEQAKKRTNLSAITVTGYADTSGPDKYNQRLSLRRAEAVKAALILKGLDGSMIKTAGQGESNLMVQTPNNTREPANRRAEIKFQ